MKKYTVRLGAALLSAVLGFAGYSNPAQSETGPDGSGADC